MYGGGDTSCGLLLTCGTVILYNDIDGYVFFRFLGCDSFLMGDWITTGTTLTSRDRDMTARRAGFEGWKDFDPHAPRFSRGVGIPYAQSNNPSAGQWTSEKLSHNMIADYKPFGASDGEGIRNSLYVSGCPFKCHECYNASIWSFTAGQEYTAELEDQIITDLALPFVQGLTLLGGEPFLNTGVCLPLVRRIREEFGVSKDIWAWSGYTYEELTREGESADKKELLEYVDVLVDGRFMANRKVNGLQFRGSDNQRIIDMRKTRATGEVVIWDKIHDRVDSFVSRSQDIKDSQAVCSAMSRQS